MINKEAYESCCFEIISAAGNARSCFLEAIENAKNGEEYQAKFDEGYDSYIKASMAHSKALELDANENLDIGLLLIHAETILSSAETIWSLSETIIELLNK